MHKTKKINIWLHFGLFIIAYLFVVGFFQFLGAAVAGVGLNGEKIEHTIGQDIIVTFFGLAGTFFVIHLFIKFLHKEAFSSLGFHYKGHTKDILAGLFLGILMIGFGYLALVFFEQIKFSGIVFRGKQFLYTAIVFIMVGFIEETLFRGYILGRFLRSMNKYSALIVSSIIFALMHGLNPNLTLLGFINLFLAGILLGVPYIFTQNLWFPISLHFSWNFFQSLFGFNVSGQDTYSLINFTAEEKNILNGGDFGFEGSILSILIQLFLIFLLLFLLRQDKEENPFRIF